MGSSSETLTLGLLQVWERSLMRIVIKMILAAHIFNETLDAVKLSQVLLNKIPNFKKRLILIRSDHCQESVHMWSIVALMFGARHK